jgi:hypothetical protein
MEPPADDLATRYRAPVYRYFRRMTEDADLAEDLTQDVFVPLLRGLPGYRARDREPAWVFTIARHVLLDHGHAPHLPVVRLSEIGEEVASLEHDPVVALGFHEAVALLRHGDRESLGLASLPQPPPPPQTQPATAPTSTPVGGATHPAAAVPPAAMPSAAPPAPRVARARPRPEVGAPPVASLRVRFGQWRTVPAPVAEGGQRQ